MDAVFRAADSDQRVFDDVVRLGLADGRLTAFSVQYHPEAAAGPHDASYLFDRFCDLMVSTSSTTATEEQA